MHVKSTAECSAEHSAILLTHIKIYQYWNPIFWSSFGWPLKTGFTVLLRTPLEKPFNPFSSEVRTTLCEIRWGIKQRCQAPLVELSGSAHGKTCHYQCTFSINKSYLWPEDNRQRITVSSAFIFWHRVRVMVTIETDVHSTWKHDAHFMTNARSYHCSEYENATFRCSLKVWTPLSLFGGID